MTEHDDDPLANLRARIRDTQEAAARLAEETASARSAAGAGRAGAAEHAEHERRTTEVHALVALLESLRDLIPHELREQFRELMRQVLLLARAIIDWWVERMEQADGAGAPGAPAGRGAEIHDIPIA